MRESNLFFSILVVFIVISCSSSPENKIPFVEGYWEIAEVKKDNRLIKEYNVNLSVDYFEVNDDSTGFRKKVSPKLDGTFAVTQDEAPFTLKIENDSLNIYYRHNDVITKETIVKATSKELIIVNSQGFRYIYKPYKPIDFEQ